MGTGATAFTGLAADLSEFRTSVVYQSPAGPISKVQYRALIGQGLLNQGSNAYSEIARLR
jgi:hypothetical protein